MQLKPICIAFAIAFGGMTALPLIAAPAAKTKPSASASMYTSVEGVTEYRLSNGLRVLLVPDASKPTTTVNVTYLVGSRHESYGETGMAHLLEHMVFKGTKTSGNIMDELSKRGMQFNGTTFYDRTNYYETFPSNDDNLRWALEMEADRMVNSKIARVDLDKEFSVVRNEMEIGENNTFRSLWQQLSAVTFDWHNYGNSTIGARSDVEGVRIENLQGFYHKFYQPDNAVLTVAGKFDQAKTLALIEKSFGKLAKPTRTITPTWTREAPRNGTREITVRRVSDEQMAAVLYPTSAGSHADGAAVLAFADIIGSSPNGRLYKSLVEGKQAVNVMNIPFQLAEPGYTMFLSTLSKDQDISAAKKTLIATVEGVAKEKITEEELKRAKTNLLNEIEKTMNNPQAFCVELSESIAMGDWRLFFLQRDRIAALTVADVERVALNYFKEDNRSFGQFIPVEKPDRAEIPVTPDVAKLVEGYKGKAAMVTGEVFDATPANIEKRTEKSTLTNGAKVALLSKKTRGETVLGNITLRLGDEKSLFDQKVSADLVTDMLMRGSSKLTRAELDTRLGELKAKLSISGGGQTVSIRFETVRSNLPALMDVVRTVLRAPTFEQSEFDLLVKENLASLESQRSEPQSVAGAALNKVTNAPYKNGDVRYKNTIDESIKMYSDAKLESAKAFYTQFYGANNAEIALVGDFDAKEMKAKLNATFGDWKSQTAYHRVASLPVGKHDAPQSFETPDKSNSFYLAHLAMPITDTSPDYAAMLVANKVLGGGIKSRLFERLRQKEGISYGAGSQFSAPSIDKEGALVMYAMFAPENGARLKVAVKEEVEKFLKDGITQAEFDDAKKAMIQERNIRLAQDAAVSGLLSNQLYLGRTMDFEAALTAKVTALTLEEVNAVIGKYLKPDNIGHIYAGDFVGAAKKAAAKEAAK
jgi:zinc protease